MRNIIFVFIILLLYSCNKPKTVLICGDHVCINQAEAEQYFEENLSLEVQVIDNKKTKEINLVELNLNKDINGKKEVTLSKKKKTKKKLIELSKTDIKEKKVALKKRRKAMIENQNTSLKNKKIESKKINKKQKIKKTKKNKPKVVNKSNQNYTDICKILKDCSIDEISKYLVKQGKDKEFPDITFRENK
jgi:hypothetical protein